MLSFINPATGAALERAGEELVDSYSRTPVATVRSGIPRFVSHYQDYADNFGYQWNKWNSILSDSRNRNSNDAKLKLLLRRVHFDQYVTDNKTILECGCGGGDDTEALLRFPFSEVHAFDLSTAVDRVDKFLKDPRLVLSQASIFEIPYADQSFDFVFCHRVLQHTPDPAGALRCVARKVKPGGVLFVHSYHRCFSYMMHFKYKYRFFTKRIPHRYIERFLDHFGPVLYSINETLFRFKLGRLIAFNFVPLEFAFNFANFSRTETIELAKLVTFDALTPAYDKPMRWSTMKNIVEEEKFKIEHYNSNPNGSPIYLTARRMA